MFIIFIILLSPINLYASWLCRESSSYAQNNHFYSCGVGESKSLSNARNIALENAKQEFHAFCNESSHCKKNEYIAKPLRTDCEQKAENYICYRGLEYTILDKKRYLEEYDLEHIKNEIHQKELTLNSLKEKLDNLKHLETLNQEIEKIKKIDSLEVEVEQLKDIKYDLENPPQNSGGFQFSYLNIEFPHGNESLFGLGLEYERYIVNRFVGIKINANYVLGIKSKEDTDDRGTPNSTSSSDYHSFKGTDFNISLPIHIKYVSIAPKYGHINVNYKSTTKDYNNFGVSLSDNIIKHSYNDTYWGCSLRYEKDYFIEIEPRKYDKNNSTEINFSAGISIDF